MPAECHAGPFEAIKRGLGKKADVATMSNAEVLDRAIATANANGWKGSVVYRRMCTDPRSS